jgi:glycosyltransferase involved in cell wall biosynthesis
MPKLSIIVPVYNGEKYLSRCIDSLIAQDIEDYEIVIVDDCSLDGTSTIIETYRKGFPGKIHSIRLQENKKAGGARNAGIQVAAGSVVGFVDSDDFVDEKMFSTMLRRMESEGSDFCDCDFFIFNEKTGEKTYEKSIDPERAGELDRGKRARLIFEEGHFCTKIFSKELFEKIHFPEGILFEDNAIIGLCSMYANKISKVNEALYYYCDNPGSTTRGSSNVRLWDRLKAEEIFLEEYRSRGFFDEYREEVLFRYFQIGQLLTLNCFKFSPNIKDITYLLTLKRTINREIGAELKAKFYLQCESDQAFVKRSREFDVSIMYFLCKGISITRLLKIGRKILGKEKK